MDGRECDFVIHLFICYNLQGSFPRMAEFFVNISLEMLGVRGGFFFYSRMRNSQGLKV